MTRGKFITLEGLDGAGKTTHLGWLADFLAERGIAVCVTREPGGTPVGERLREIVLGGAERLNAETEVLLMFAARREHLERVILPALSDGKWVLCDRFTDATYAYQSGGSGVAWDRVETLERWVHGDCQPDLTLLFDVAPEIGRQRSRGARRPDRFEQETQDFHARVRAAYLRRAREHPGRIRVVDATRSLSDVQRQLEQFVVTACK